jgi:hypothetical protein
MRMDGTSRGALATLRPRFQTGRAEGRSDCANHGPSKHSRHVVSSDAGAMGVTAHARGVDPPVHTADLPPCLHGPVRGPLVGRALLDRRD